MATPPAASAALHSSDWAWLRRPYGLLLVMAVLALAFAGRLSANPVQVGSGGALGGSLTINKILTSGGAIPAGGWTFHLVGNGATCQGDAMPTPTLDLLITVPATGGTVSTDPFPVTNDLGQFCTYTLTEVPVAGWQSSLPAAGVTFTFTTGATLPAPLSWDGTNILAQVTNTPVDDGGEVGSSTTTTTPPPDDTTPPITGTGTGTTTPPPTTTTVRGTTSAPPTTTTTTTPTTSPATTSVSTTSSTPAPSTTTPSPGLAVTGTNSLALVLLALVLMVTGSLALLASRRRAHNHD